MKSISTFFFNNSCIYICTLTLAIWKAAWSLHILMPVWTTTKTHKSSRISRVLLLHWLQSERTTATGKLGQNYPLKNSFLSKRRWQLHKHATWQIILVAKLLYKPFFIRFLGMDGGYCYCNFLHILYLNMLATYTSVLLCYCFLFSSCKEVNTFIWKRRWE